MAIYLDHGATTPLAPEVRAAMAPWLGEEFGNPASLHTPGRAAARAVEEARARVARLLGAEPREILFTGGGSEACNMALKGLCLRPGRDRAHLIVTAVEHKAVLEPARYLERLGVEVTVLPVSGEGRVDPDDVRRALRPHTVLVSVIHGQNEIGALEPVAEIAAVTRAAGVWLHVDAVQTVGQIPVDVRALGCDLLSLSAHKFYGPKGAGALYVRGGVGERIPLEPLHHGGFQEEGLRGGTLPVADLVGLGAAAALATEERLAAWAEGQAALRDHLIEGVLAQVPRARLTGPRTERLPGHASFLFPGLEGEELVIALDREGFAVSTGSACTAGLLDPSHVLRALGYAPALARGALRVTLGRNTTREEVDRFLAVLPEVVARLYRAASGEAAG